ncbi:MAG: rhomboid family intramembrane serine protease [Ferruginibacter sp.]
MNFSQSPVTFILIAVNIFISLIGFSSPRFLSKTIMSPYIVKRKKQYYRMITSGFLHADIMHLFFNMFTLFFFGSAIEYYFSKYGLGGSTAYLALYFLSLVASDIPSYLKHQDDQNYHSLGASGAVSAVVFSSIVFGPWNEIRLYGLVSISFMIYAILFIWYCIYMGKKSNDNINHDAHLWGSFFGLAFTVILIVVLDPALFNLVIKEMAEPSLFGRQPIYLK